MTSRSFEEIILELHAVEAIKFGDFTLKSGIQSPIYFDLRVIVSFPKLMSQVSELLWEAVKDSKTKFASVCGVPYTALPLATLMAANHDVPMLIRRKEAKDYGTKKMIEGRFSPGDVCMVVEDVVTSGTSVLETVQTLKSVDIVVHEAVVLLDREQGGSQRLKDNGILLHSVCTISRLLEILLKHGRLTQGVVDSVRAFVSENSTINLPAGHSGKGDGTKTQAKPKVLTYRERAALSSHPLTARLFSLMETKKTNLALSADVTSSKELLQLAEALGHYICILKTHIDILDDFTPATAARLQDIAARHNFLLFEDRKFADIGNTVKKQYSGGVYHISEWADIINAHVVPGPGIIQGLKEVGKPLGRGCLLLAEMSSEGTLATGEYTKAAVKMAESHSDFVVGFVSTSRVSDNPQLVHMTPGVKLECGGDALGQQYLTPEEVITRRGSDVIIVGRGILQASDQSQAAREYREAGYKAYLSATQGETS